MTLHEQMTELARQAKEASRALIRLAPQERDGCLLAMADALEAGQSEIQEANARDLDTGKELGLSPALLDRLKLDEKRVRAMAEGLRQVAGLPDPLGRLLEERTLPNGLVLRKRSTPIGVIVIIYESRPNVTADAAGLCFKSGNATILRGGREAVHSNRIIAQTMVEASRRAVASFPLQAIQVVPVTDREAIPALLSQTSYVDLCIPRGGEGLIRAVAESSRVPVIKHYKGVCHVFVDADADLRMAEEISVNAKVQRPGVCNAMETLLVDRAIAPKFLPSLARRLAEHQVELRADETAFGLLEHEYTWLKPASPDDWTEEYLDYILAVRVVEGVGAAIDHVNRYGSAHSDTIVTQNENHARQFLQDVDSAAVYWNASPRFTDGSQFGMGAEIGISTDKIGARGPMGLNELTSYKWVGYGTGQIRT